MKPFKIRIVHKSLEKVILDRIIELGYPVCPNGREAYDGVSEGYRNPAYSYFKYKDKWFLQGEFEHFRDVPEITIEQLFSEEFRVKKPIKVELNNEYTAVISEKGVTVGCQTFSFEKIAELQEAVAKFQNS